ncbi:MAG: hypothetical protein ACRDNI_09845, partial [Gaiellaceae bacterium]
GAALDLRTDEWRILEDPDAAYEASVPVWDDSLAGILDDSGARYFHHFGDVRDERAARTLRMPQLEPLAEAYGGTTEVTAGNDLLVFLGSEWSDPDGALHSRAWLWSPRS